MGRVADSACFDHLGTFLILLKARPRDAPSYSPVLEAVAQRRANVCRDGFRDFMSYSSKNARMKKREVLRL